MYRGRDAPNSKFGGVERRIASRQKRKAAIKVMLFLFFYFACLSLAFSLMIDLSMHAISPSCSFLCVCFVLFWSCPLHVHAKMLILRCPLCTNHPLLPPTAAASYQSLSAYLEAFSGGGNSGRRGGGEVRANLKRRYAGKMFCEERPTKNTHNDKYT